MDKPFLNSMSPLYPIPQQSYERYLPTAFDPSMDILEKINQVIMQLDRMGRLTNDVVEQWNRVMQWVMNDGLEESVSNKIQQLLDSGYFDDLIRTLFGEEFTYTSLKHNAFLGAYLDVPDIIQSCVYDSVNKCLYVAYEDQHKRFDNPTMIVSKHDMTGRLLDEMFLQGFSHGDGMCIDNTHTENIVLNLMKDGVYKTVRVAFSSGKTFTDFSEFTIIPLFNGQDNKVFFNEDLSVFAIINPSTDNIIRVYKRNLFEMEYMPNPDFTIPFDSRLIPFQGMGVGKKSLFVATGDDSTLSTANIHPQVLREYSLEDGSLIEEKPYSSFASSLSANGYSEPEGLQVVTDEFNNEILIINYSHGEYRQRINDIYEISAKGVAPLTRRVIKGYYKENGVVKGYINDANYVLANVFEAGAFYVDSASDTPTGRKGFLYNDISNDGTNILQTFVSSANISYRRWIYWTNSTKTVTDWVDEKTDVNFSREDPINATFVNGVSNGSGFFPQLFTYKESSPVGSRAYIGGTFAIDSATLPITGGWHKIATVAHIPFQKVPIVVTSFSASVNNVMGYIDTDGSVYVQGSGSTSGYYTVGEQTYRIPAS